MKVASIVKLPLYIHIVNTVRARVLARLFKRAKPRQNCSAVVLHYMAKYSRGYTTKRENCLDIRPI
jgi:hypothetical protein